MAPHTGVRYVIDPHVASQLLRDEPHLRSVITAERYVNRLNSPDAMTEAMSDGLLNAQTDPRPGELLVIDFNNLDFTMHSGTGARNRSWSAQWEAHGELFVF